MTGSSGPTPAELADAAFGGGRPRDEAAESRAHDELRNRLFGTPQPRDGERYRIDRRVGVGGAGEVYEAWDRELKRRVAMKVLRPASESDPMDTRARERLVREAQAIAQLSHPNVVSVFDVGTCTPAMVAALGTAARGAVYLVMEYLDGPTLRAWLEGERRSLAEILEAFGAAAHGLAAAHAKGIVHRDFKPSNVVICESSRADHLRERVRVVDFGLARAAGLAETSSSVDSVSDPDLGFVLEDLTQTGVVMGTPPYMAPEQHRGEPADHRADQFAFGVALWEAVYGERPFRGDSLAALRAAKELPPRVAAGIRVPRWLDRALRRAIAPTPADRHPSMAAFAASLAHGAGRRKRALAVGAIVVVAALCTATGAVLASSAAQDVCDAEGPRSIWTAEVAATVGEAMLASGHPRADSTWARVRSAIDDYARSLVTAHERACTIEDPSRRAASIACLEERHARLDAAVEVLMGADATVAEHAVEIVAELPVVASCDEPDIMASDRPRPSRSRALLRASAMELAGKIDEAEAIASAIEQDAAATDDRATVAVARIVLGRVLLARSGIEPEAAEARFHGALVAAESAGDTAAAVEALTMLAHTVGSVDGRFREANQFADQARAKLGHLGSMGDAAAALDYEVGLLRLREYRNADALVAFRSALEQREALLGSEHPKVAKVRVEIGNVLLREEREDEARIEFERALGILERVWGPDHAALGGPLSGLGSLDRRAGNLLGSLQRYERALAISLSAHGERHDSVAVASSNLALAQSDLGRHGDALASLDRALGIRLELFGPDHAAVARTRTNRAGTLAMLGRHDEAAAELRIAVEVFTKAMGPEHATVGVALMKLGQALWSMDERDDAIEAVGRAAVILENHGDVERSAAARAFAQVGVYEFATGRIREGRVHFEHAQQLAPTVELARQIAGDLSRVERGVRAKR